MQVLSAHSQPKKKGTDKEAVLAKARVVRPAMAYLIGDADDHRAERDENEPNQHKKQYDEPRGEDWAPCLECLLAEGRVWEEANQIHRETDAVRRFHRRPNAAVLSRSTLGTHRAAPTVRPSAPCRHFEKPERNERISRTCQSVRDPRTLRVWNR